MELEDNKRRRHISEAEEDALLAVASPHLRSMIIAAADTGMGRGEMLAIRFGDIDWKRRRIRPRGATTKSRLTRVIPIGTARLLAVVQWLRLDSAGEHKADDVPVFSNEAGEPLKTFKKEWVVAVLKAHSVDPHWRKGSYQDLSTECQQRLREINLHWHDLWHKYASRLVERGVPLAQVRDLLGHASILTTERYDNQRLEALQAAIERLETGKTFNPVRLKPDTSDEASDNLPTEAASYDSAEAEVSRIFQVPAGQRFTDGGRSVHENRRSH